jgi:flagellar biosynthesis protein FlhG
VKSVAEAKKVSDRMTSIAGQFLNLKVEYLGFIYDDPVVSQSVVKQKPFMRLDPRSKASVCIQSIVKRLEKNEVRESGSITSKLKRLLGRG